MSQQPTVTCSRSNSEVQSGRGKAGAFSNTGKDTLIIDAFFSSPECRRRKIKCDEQRPRCGQCQKGGRNCHILDSVFKKHAFQFEQGVPDHATRANRLDVDDSAVASTNNVQANLRQNGMRTYALLNPPNSNIRSRKYR
jgi:hypothetical protein